MQKNIFYCWKNKKNIESAQLWTAWKIGARLRSSFIAKAAAHGELFSPWLQGQQVFFTLSLSADDLGTD